MPVRRARWPEVPVQRDPCGSSVSFLLLRWSLDRDRLLRNPTQLDAPATLFDQVRRRAFEILFDDDELSARVEVDEVTRHHAGVDQLGDASALDVRAALRVGIRVEDPELF